RPQPRVEELDVDLGADDGRAGTSEPDLGLEQLLLQLREFVVAGSATGAPRRAGRLVEGKGLRVSGVHGVGRTQGSVFRGDGVIREQRIAPFASTGCVGGLKP